jgi:hypothetical protein
MFIETKENFAEGQTLRLVIPGTKIDKGIMLKGEIKHLNRKGIGVQFKRILKYIKNKSTHVKSEQNKNVS